ncbi:conserved hypothetical protein [Trichinella spiralis]|uniref:Uncharacterized protein n=1 Tax=Trichinella spiralis TaxID=6334 RepID=E5SVM5_TRISP|nr:conserved hypothetical protein [Trichinella spiralis]KRY27659.1 hypothetical protein T01_14452 [Trichinella spiralis]
MTDSLNFLLTSSSELVSASCATPIESISQNLLNSQLSSSVAPAELLFVTVETMVVPCLPAELRAFGPQRIHPKMVSMAMGSSSPATLSMLYGALFADIQNTTRVSGHIAIVPARRVRRIAGKSQQDGFRSTPRSFRPDPLVWWPS